MIGGLVITPGPSTLLAFVVAATSPVKQSYRLMLGVLLAILLLTAVTSLLSYISYLVSPIFLRMLKAVSLFFIFYIGVKMLISYKKAPDPDKNKSTNSPFANGFAISFFNAKPLAFYLSFLPGIAQTSDGWVEYMASSFVLIAIHIFLALLSLLLYTWLGTKLSAVLSIQALNVLSSLVGGLLLILAIKMLLSFLGIPLV